MNPSPINAYLERSLADRGWSWADLAASSGIAYSTLWRMRTNHLILTPHYWTKFYLNSNLKIPLRLFDPLSQSQIRLLLREMRRPARHPAYPCGLEPDWPPGTLCAHYRGGNNFTGPGCYLKDCPSAGQHTQAEPVHEA